MIDRIRSGTNLDVSLQSAIALGSPVVMVAVGLVARSDALIAVGIGLAAGVSLSGSV